MPMPSKIYPGCRSGKLTAEYKTGQTDGKYPVWHCKCDCGQQKEVSAHRLTRGKVRSCGCLQKERVQEALRLMDGTSVTILESVKKGLRRDNTSGHIGVCRLKSGYYLAWYYETYPAKVPEA